MIIQQVPVEWANRVWGAVAGFIEDALVHACGDYSIAHVQAFVTSGQWVLLVATEDGEIKGAATVCLYNRPTDRVALITTTGGRLVVDAGTFAQLKRLMAALGATTIEAAVRGSMARMLHRFGFSEKYTVTGVRL